MTEITDSVLINNLYRILCLPEFGLSEFRGIFEKIGILSEVENGEIRHEQIRRINEWIERNRGSNNDEIRLIECLEKFRELSKGEGNFNEQLKVTENIIEYLLKLLPTPTSQLLLLPVLYMKIMWRYLKKTQGHALRTAEFGRDHIIHSFRVFLLGCYILYSLYNEKGGDYITKCFKEDLRLLRLIICECFPDIRNRENIRKFLEEVKLGFEDILWMWLLSSLFHDIGRPIEDAVEEIKRLMNTYNIEGIDIDSLIFIVAEVPKVNSNKIEVKVNGNKIEKFTELLEKILRDSDNNNSNFCGQIRQFLRNRTRSEKKWDHGILSATIIYSLLTEAEVYNIFLEKLSRRERFSILFHYSDYYLLFCLLLYPLIAIMLHTEPSKYIFSTSLTQLLIICDELQEWNRITAIGDKEVMIFPCKSLHLELKDGEMQVFIPYERPIDVISQEIFRRFDPKRRWREIAEGVPVCRNNDLLFQKITVRILLDQTGKICTIEIHPNGINYSISHPFLY